MNKMKININYLSNPQFRWNFKDLTKDNDIGEVMMLVDYFYPEAYLGEVAFLQQRKYPLTRCILTSLIAYIKFTEDVKHHNINRLIQLLQSLLDEQYEFIDAQIHWLPLWVRRCWYAYLDSSNKTYTISHLIYDLLPFQNLTFEEISNYILKGYGKLEIINNLKWKYSCNDEHMNTMIYNIKDVSEKLFAENDIIEKSIFQLIVYEILYENSVLDLNFDMELIKNKISGLMNNQFEWEYDFHNSQISFVVNTLKTIISYNKKHINSAIVRMTDRLLWIDNKLIQILNDDKYDNFQNMKNGGYYHMEKVTRDEKNIFQNEKTENYQNNLKKFGFGDYSIGFNPNEPFIKLF